MTCVRIINENNERPLAVAALYYHYHYHRPPLRSPRQRRRGGVLRRADGDDDRCATAATTSTPSKQPSPRNRINSDRVRSKRLVYESTRYYNNTADGKRSRSNRAAAVGFDRVFRAHAARRTRPPKIFFFAFRPGTHWLNAPYSPPSRCACRPAGQLQSETSITVNRSRHTRPSSAVLTGIRARARGPFVHNVFDFRRQRERDRVSSSTSRVRSARRAFDLHNIIISTAAAALQALPPVYGKFTPRARVASGRSRVYTCAARPVPSETSSGAHGDRRRAVHTSNTVPSSSSSS